MKKLAVIDLGSNSIRMSIFDPSAPQRALKTFRKATRLSEGMTCDGLLKAESQLRTVNTLLEYKQILEAEGIEIICAVATAAVRKAQNQQEFLALIKDITGIRIQVIDGCSEAALDSLAISRTLSCRNGVICDIGGGSTELIGVGNGNSPAISIPHGSRGICEMFFSNGQNSRAIKSAQAFADGLVSSVEWLRDYRGSSLVGIGGTIRALAKFNMGDASKASIEKYELSVKRMFEIFDQIETADTSHRAKMVGIGTERADIILGGIVLLRAIMNLLLPEKILICDAGVREGVFFDLLENHGILKWNE